MGQNAEAVAAVVASGNDIATHTWSHENLKELSSARAKRALTNGIDKITEMTGREVHFVRPPYGAWNSNVCGVCRDLGLSIVTWSIDTLDWKTRDAEKTFQTIKQQVKNGDIILCHDTYEATADAVDMLFPGWWSRGIRCCRWRKSSPITMAAQSRAWCIITPIRRNLLCRRRRNKAVEYGKMARGRYNGCGLFLCAFFMKSNWKNTEN